MGTERDEPIGHADKKIWAIAPVIMTIVFLTCVWLALCGITKVREGGGYDDGNAEAARLTSDNSETIRLVAQEPNGFKVSYQHQGQAGKFYIVIRFALRAPMRGQNHLSVIVLDSFRNKVGGATVKIGYFMPSLPGRPPMMHHETIAQQEKDLYHADVNLSMKGEWIFRVNVTKGDERGTFQFPVEVLR